MTIKELRELTGLTQARFAEKYKIKKRTLENWEEGTRNPPPYVLELLEKVIQAESEEGGMSWIPVSERLPEEETDVLICNGHGDIELSMGSYSTEFENDFIWYTSGWSFGKVIAWMPLPKPYEPQEGGKYYTREEQDIRYAIRYKAESGNKE